MHNLHRDRPAFCGLREVARQELSPSGILERLRVIEALTADGRPIPDALRVAGVAPAENEKWRNEYSGLLRTLGPLASPPTKVAKESRRTGPSRPVRTMKQHERSVAEGKFNASRALRILFATK